MRLRFYPSAALGLLLLLRIPLAGAEGVCTRLELVDEAPEPGDDPRLTLTADEIDWVDGGLSRLSGGVELRQEDRVFRSEALDFLDDEQAVRTRVRSIFRNRDLIVLSESAAFDLTAQTGVFTDTRFNLLDRGGRGAAETLKLSGERRVELDEVSFTTCSPEAETWRLKAQRIRLDAASGLGTARHARLSFGPVPVLYLPYFQFPIDGQRRTGLLFPVFGRADSTGTDLRWPIYLNLAPNYDATLTPRYMAERGTLIGTQGRYLLRNGEGALGYDVLPRDARTDTRRSYARAEHRGLINQRLALDAQYAEVSDPGYFEDLGGNIDLAAITHLERSARLTYQAPGSYTLLALVQDYQTITRTLDPVDEPYRRLPQVQARALTRNSLFDTRAGLRADYVNFAREDSVQGQRVDLRPFLRYEWDDLGRYTVAELDLRYTAYQLTGLPEGADRSPDRLLPTLGVETGLRFDRLTASGQRQTLEPRALYLYVPFRDQSDLPIFDSGEPDFDFTQLFARNRFSGDDRVSDAHHVAVAATSRLLDPTTGQVRWTASVGQLYRLSAPRVELPGFATPDNGPTDFIGSLDYRFTERFSARLDTQWSPDEERFDRTRMGLRYRHDRGEAFVDYRYRAELLEQADLGFKLRLPRGYQLIQRYRYSLQDSQTLDSLVGLGYERCCWGLRAAYRRFLAGTEGRFDTGFYLQLELKGLASIGADMDPLPPGQQRSSF